MQKDVYAIYEAYVTEDGYTSVSTTKTPGQVNPIMASANDTNRNVSNTGGIPYGQGNANPDPIYNQAEETREHKSLNREILKLQQLAKLGKYEDVVMYCKTVSKLAEDAYNKKTKK